MLEGLKEKRQQWFKAISYQSDVNGNSTRNDKLVFASSSKNNKLDEHDCNTKHRNNKWHCTFDSIGDFSILLLQEV